MERRASRPSCKLFRKILRRRSLDPRWRRLFRFRSLAPRNQPVQVIPVRPIRAEALFIEQSLGATSQADLVRIALASHRPAHPAMPAPPKRDHGHSRQASRHHPQRPQPPVFPRFFAPLRAFCHHSSQGTHDLQHRPDCSVGQTQRVVPAFSFSSPFSPAPTQRCNRPCTIGHCGTCQKNTTLRLQAPVFCSPGEPRTAMQRIITRRASNAMKSSSAL